MPHGTRIAVVFALVAGVAAAPVPVRGQSDNRHGPATPFDVNALGRPDRIAPPRFPEPQRGSPPPAPSWGSPAGPAATPSFGGIMTEQQAMDRVAAAGFTDVRPLQPGYHGNWTGYASKRGRTVRVTIDPQGNVSTR